MAEKKVIEVEIQDNTKSLKSQYKDAVTELQKLSATYGETSMEAIKAAKAAAELKDRIEDTNDLIKTQKGEGAFIAVGKSIQAASSGLAAYEGALGLIGVESEELQKTMLRVQSAMALAQGLEGLEDAGRAFKTLGAVVKNTTLFTSAYNFVMGISNKETATNVLVTEADTTAKVGLTGATGVLSTVTGGATTAMKLFRVALIATGIGAIIVLVGLLIANFDKVTAVVTKLSGYVIKAYDYFDNLGTGIKVLVGIFFPFIGVVYGAIKALEYFNVIDTKNERDMSARHVANIKRIDKELAKREEAKKARKKAYDEETGNIDRQIKLLEAQGKSTEALEKLQLKRSLTNQRELIKEARLNLQILRATNIGGVNDQMIEETLTAIAQMKQGILNTETDIQISRIETTKVTKTQAETNKELAKTLEDLTQKNTQYGLSEQELLKLNKLKTDALIQEQFLKSTDKDKEKQRTDALLANEIDYGNQLNALRKKEVSDLDTLKITSANDGIAKLVATKTTELQIEKDTADKKIAIEKLLNEQKATIQQQGLDTALQGIGVIKSIFEKSKGVQKAAVIAESAIGIAKMIISNKLANIGALATPQAIATSGAAAAPVIALNNISTGFGIAANVAATAKALSALGGGSAPSGSVGGGGSGGSGGGGFNPSFNVVGSSGINQLAGIQQQPVKAYITTGEVSTALSLERNTLQKTTF
jgi:hypothetical protein